MVSALPTGASSRASKGRSTVTGSPPSVSTEYWILEPSAYSATSRPFRVKSAPSPSDRNRTSSGRTISAPRQPGGRASAPGAAVIAASFQPMAPEASVAASKRFTSPMKPATKRLTGWE